MSKQPIVVGVDGSKEALGALRWAAKEAKLRGLTIELVHAWDAPWSYWDATVPIPMGDVEKAQWKLMAEEVAKAGPDLNGLDIKSEISNDLPARVLIDKSKDAEMVVVGSRGRGGFVGLLLGSVSQQVVHHARCPVVVVPLSED